MKSFGTFRQGFLIYRKREGMSTLNSYIEITKRTELTESEFEFKGLDN